MAVTPDTQVTLLKCPIELDNSNQITFASASAQHTYFNGLPKLTESNFSYQRKDGVIRFPAHIDSLLEYNYVMYQNTHYTNKWFYCFITKMEYVNDSLTLIHIKTDTYQTWMFDITFKRSFVEREHVLDDTIGKHTIDEGLELGDFTINGVDEVDELKNSLPALAISATPDTDSQIAYLPGRMIGNLYTGLTYEAFGTNAASLTALKNRINSYVSNGVVDRILGICMIPVALTNYDPSSSEVFVTSNFNQWTTINKQVQINPTIDGYTPKNNKLYTHPFNYLLVSNNAGVNNVYKYEFFPTLIQPTFVIDVMPGFGCSGICAPIGYKNLDTTINWNEGIPLAKYGICSWIADSYTNWMSQNSLNNTLSYITAGTEIAAGVIASSAEPTAGAGLIATGLGGIVGTLQQKHNAQFIPPRAEVNSNNGDINQVLGRNTITFYKMSIKKEIAQSIDSFLSMFGYKVNELKVPNRNSRRYWNYIKTIDVNIVGDIPQEDMQEIKNMFNNGITLWHDTSHFLDYSQNNSIVV